MVFKLNKNMVVATAVPMVSMITSTNQASMITSANQASMITSANKGYLVPGVEQQKMNTRQLGANVKQQDAIVDEWKAENKSSKKRGKASWIKRDREREPEIIREVQKVALNNSTTLNREGFIQNFASIEGGGRGSRKKYESAGFRLYERLIAFIQQMDATEKRSLLDNLSHYGEPDPNIKPSEDILVIPPTPSSAIVNKWQAELKTLWGGQQWFSRDIARETEIIHKVQQVALNDTTLNLDEFDEDFPKMKANARDFVRYRFAGSRLYKSVIEFIQQKDETEQRAVLDDLSHYGEANPKKSEPQLVTDDEQDFVQSPDTSDEEADSDRSADHEALDNQDRKNQYADLPKDHEGRVIDSNADREALDNQDRENQYADLPKDHEGRVIDRQEEEPQPEPTPSPVTGGDTTGGDTTGGDTTGGDTTGGDTTGGNQPPGPGPKEEDSETSNEQPKSKTKNEEGCSC